jgi:hypothetical protein
MLYAEAASVKYGVRGLPDAIWARIEAERETPPREAQSELFDTPQFSAPAASAAAQPAIPPKQTVSPAKFARSSSRSGYMD